MSEITVGCKLPSGIHMDLGGKRITLNGSNSALVVGGHGITQGVDKAHFDAWMALHRESPMVKNELIFSHDKVREVQAKAADNAEKRNGFEGLDPKKPAPGIEPVAVVKGE